MITVVLTDNDRDRRGNIILGNVVAAIVRAELPDDRRKQMDELSRLEHERAKAIHDAPPRKRKKLAKELTGCRLLTTDKEIADAEIADAEKGIVRRARTDRYPNRFTEERKAWAAIHAEVVSGKIKPKDEDGTQLPQDDYGIGSVTDDELTGWGRRAGYDFQLQENEERMETHVLLGYHAAVARKFGTPDWDYWLSLQFWTAREAACLLVELNPGRYDMVAVDRNPQPRQLAEHIATIERKAAREQQAGKLCEKLSPQLWAAWAENSGYALPDRLQRIQAQIEELPADAGSGGGAVKVAAGGTAKRNQWTDAALKALWQESILPGMTQKILAEKFEVTHQSISKQLKRASERFSKTTSKASAKKKTWLS